MGFFKNAFAHYSRGWDLHLLGCVVLLLLIGSVAIASASGPIAQQLYGDSLFFFQRHMVHTVLGLGALFCATLMPTSLLRKLTMPSVYVCLFLLALTLVPSWGVKVGGAQRWLDLGFFRLQPVEILKPTLILLFAHHLAPYRGREADFWYHQMRPLLWTGVSLFMVLLQPDFGGVALLVGAVFMVLFIGGAPLAHLGLAGMVAGVVLGVLTFSEPYRMRRVTAFLDPWADRLDSGFQIIQSYLALGGGGLLGLGLGASRQKRLFLPDAHTDFIFSIWGEETGFLGVVALLALYAVFFWRAFRLSWHLEERFARLMASGLSCTLALQTLIHLFVVMGLVPAKGLPLPFMSYGGASLITNLWMTGLLLGLQRRQVLLRVAPHRSTLLRKGATG